MVHLMAKLPFLLALAVASLLTGIAAAQEGQTSVQLTGGFRQDTTAPVAVESDRLSVDQGAGKAVFTGNVRVRQGDMRMTAAEATLVYSADGSQVESVLMTGGVTMTNGVEAAEGRDAVYTIASGEVVMTGDVLLTQGKSTINGQELTVDLDTGLGVMTGRVQTVFVPGKSSP